MSERKSKKWILGFKGIIPFLLVGATIALSYDELESIRTSIRTVSFKVLEI